MKKMWMALVIMLALLCWGSCAGADEYVLCEDCGRMTAGYWEDCGEYHRTVCKAYGHIGELEEHIVYCNNTLSCSHCGNSENLSNANFGHSYEEITYDEYKHYKVCVCGTTEEYHRAQCWKDRTTCNDCYAQNVIIAEENLYHYYIRANVNGMCQNKCKYCDAVWGEAMPHYSWCDEPNKCVNCQTICETSEITIIHSTEYINLGDEHQQQCTLCGEMVSEASPHKSYCDAPNICSECEAQFEANIDDISHREWQCVSAGDKHAYQCRECLYVLYTQIHYARCNNPTTCIVCEAQMENMYILHEYTYTVDGNYHKVECAYCDYSETARHSVWCDLTENCYYCDASVSISENEYMHSLQTNSVITDEKHSFDCEICNKHVEYVHTYEQGVCIVCGYKKGSQAAAIPGDSDNNSAVNLNDAIAILTGEVSNEANADVNGDGLVDIDDALRLLQYLAGWNVVLE